MDTIKLEIENIFSFIDKDKFANLLSEASNKNNQLHNKTGKGNDFVGWVDLPNNISAEDIQKINTSAKQFRKNKDVIVVIGIGGSYLGAKAIIDSLSGNFDGYNNNTPKVVFAGQNISEDYLVELKEFLENKSFGIVVISKSGTTTEPALAFRILKSLLEEKYDKAEIAKRIIAITDKEKGALLQLAKTEGYETYIIPDDVGGRYSVLTPVGLYPIAVAGFDIEKLINGAKDMSKKTSAEIKENNIAIEYALSRFLLYNSGKTLEILANYEPKLASISEWWKQLFGESEGKEGKGIFPASVSFTTDLHSMGQYIQDGKRNIFETVISVNQPKSKLVLEKDSENLDGLNYLSGKRINEINKMAELGTNIAHTKGGVPIIKINLPEINEYYIGQLIYFFEKTCAISGYLLEINPFDQPGVEEYKKNMFALLGKIGYEDLAKELKK